MELLFFSHTCLYGVSRDNLKFTVYLGRLRNGITRLRIVGRVAIEEVSYEK
jgi:hypothetical protein